MQAILTKPRDEDYIRRSSMMRSEPTHETMTPRAIPRGRVPPWKPGFDGRVAVVHKGYLLGFDGRGILSAEAEVRDGCVLHNDPEVLGAHL